MTHLYDTIEPNVISEALLRRCVEEQGPEGEAGRIARDEGIDFAEVTELRLDFKNILRVENLWQFTHLRKLQLDNNIIEDIVGLDTLTHLEWLDLSFNNIEVVSGLEALVNLRDLSLAHNRIQRIENIDTLTQLQVLSVGNNLIEDLDNVKYLRQFHRLQSLNLKGNPISEDDQYQHFVVAFVPSVLYLDFRLVLEDERDAAKQRFHDDLEVLEMEEREQKRRAEEELAIQTQEQLLLSSYVDGLQGDVLYKALFEEDTDNEKLRKLPNVEDMLQEYEKRFFESCEHLTKVGLEEKVKREEEVEVFRTSLQLACSSNQQLSVERVREFETLKHKLLPRVGESVSASSREELQEAIRTLQHDLMSLEMQLVDQLEEISKDFERNYSDLVEGFLENVQSHMTQMRELETTHHEKVTEIAINHLERFVKNQVEEELPDELRLLFVDKDTLVGAINAAHDTHSLVIDNKEDKIVSRARKDLNVLLEGIQEVEQARNRQKVVEIEQYIVHQREEMEGDK